MEAFIIYKAAMDEPLNLNSIVLKEVVDMRNHSSRALLYDALLTKIFSHFRVKVSNQRNQYIDQGFSITIIKRDISIDSTEGEDEGEEASNRQNMEVQRNLKVPPPQNEETYVDPSAQNLQLQWQSEETFHGEHLTHEEDPMHKEYPMHGGQPLQEGIHRKDGYQHGFSNILAS